MEQAVLLEIEFELWHVHAIPGNRTENQQLPKSSVIDHFLIISFCHNMESLVCSDIFHGLVKVVDIIFCSFVEYACVSLTIILPFVLLSLVSCMILEFHYNTWWVAHPDVFLLISYPLTVRVEVLLTYVYTRIFLALVFMEI